MTDNSETVLQALEFSPCFILTFLQIDMASVFYYVAVKGALSANDCDAFGLDPEEISALTKFFPTSNTQVNNGVVIKGTLLDSTCCVYLILCRFKNSIS